MFLLFNKISLAEFVLYYSIIGIKIISMILSRWKVNALYDILYREEITIRDISSCVT